jgi:hypothetical protein
MLIEVLLLGYMPLYFAKKMRKGIIIIKSRVFPQGV